MLGVLIAICLATSQAAGAHPAAAFVGKWTATEVPPPGEASLGPPSFDLALQDGKAIVTLERQRVTVAVLYEVAPQTGRLTLMVSVPSAARIDLFIIRMLDGKRAEVDLFMTPKGPAQRGTHVPLGVYLKGK